MSSILVDSTIIVLLVASLCYGISVTRRLKNLMEAIKAIEPLVRDFSLAVDKSESSVNQMRETLADIPSATELDFEPQEVAARRPVQSPTTIGQMGARTVQNHKDLVRSFFEETRLQEGT